MLGVFLLSLLFVFLRTTPAHAIDLPGVPRQCTEPCGEADLEGFSACFDLVMSPSCRSDLCEKWYYNSTIECLLCITEHTSGTELQDFSSVVDVYNSTCQNMSLVSNDTFLNGTYLNGSTVNRTAPMPEPTMPTAPVPAAALQLVSSGSVAGILLVAGATALLL